MCLQDVPQSTIMSQQTQSDCGPTLERYKLSRLMEDTGDILSRINKIKRKRDKRSFTAELAELSKKEISRDNVNIFGKDIPIMNLLRTSEVESTSKEPVSLESWKASSIKISEKLSLHTEIDGPELDLNYLNGYFKSLNQKSSVLIKKSKIQKENLPKTSWKSLPYSLQGFTEKGLTKTLKIKLLPTKGQQHRLKMWMDMYRLLYNMESNMIFTSDEFVEKKKILGSSTVRDMTLARGKFKNREVSPKHQTYIDIIECMSPSAILDCVHPHVTGNYKTCKSNRHYNHAKLQMLKKHKKGIFKVTSHGYSMESNAIKLLPSFLNNVPIKMKPLREHEKELIQLNTQELSTLTIQESEGIYYAAFTISVNSLPNLSKKVTAFDPGIRTFMTTADSEGKINEHGSCIYAKINKYIRRVISRPAKNKKQHRAIERLKTKVDKFVNDFHCKLAKYLAINNAAIIAPELGSYLCRKKQRCIWDHLLQRMVHHANFSHRLRNACQTYSCHYLYSKEHYTTMGCSQCNNSYKVGSEKTYKCPKGCMSIDRDVNAARNIFSRFIVLSSQ